MFRTTSRLIPWTSHASLPAAVGRLGQRPVRMILGATGQMGTLLRNHFAATETSPILGTSRTGAPKDEVALDNVSWVRTPSPKCEKAWKDVFLQTLSTLKEGEYLSVINTIGGPEAPEGQTFDDINVTPSKAAIEGLMAAAEELGMTDRIHFTHITSIAAGEGRLPNDPYAQSRTKSENIVLKRGGENVTIFRMGYGIATPIASDKLLHVDNHHGYSPDQLATLPFQPIVGDGKQPVQPVAMDDTIEAIANAPLHRNVRIVDAVGREVLTQSEFIRFFREDLAGKPFRPVHLPVEECAIMANYHPCGHFAPYAVEYLAIGGFELDPTNMETLVGRPLKTLKEIHSDKKGKTVVMTRPPLVNHTKKIFKKMLKHRTVAHATTKSAARIIKHIAKEAAKATTQKAKEAAHMTIKAATNGSYK